MDGKWKWPPVLLLFVCALPKMLWLKLFPLKPSPVAKYLKEQQARAVRDRLDNLPVTAEEEEAWRELEKRQ
ncbi:MAG: hypothetical protein WBF88_07295 [Pusillimonas sp.]